MRLLNRKKKKCVEIKCTFSKHTDKIDKNLFIQWNQYKYNWFYINKQYDAK